MHKAWESALIVMSQLEIAGYEAVIVGGAVRDRLMQRTASDVDVATSALPDEVKQVFSHTVDVGIEHGTILVLDAGEPIEVTTYRTESTYSDFRRPDQVTFVRSLREDMKRRDFTMNAMAMRANGEIVDYFGGTEDIENGVIRAVGNAEERFQEDALRMLRAIRFSAQLGFSIADETFDAISKHAHLIQHIAVERIVQEMDKLFTGDVKRAFEVVQGTQLGKWLKGNFASEPWQNANPWNADVGWCYFNWLSNDEGLLTHYKSSNARKGFVKRVCELVKLPIEDWNVFVLFNYSLDELLAANAVKEWSGMAFWQEDELRERKHALPIQLKRELAVSGKEILAWQEEKRGPWVKEHLAAIVAAVLAQEVKNELQAIKEWYDAKYNKR